MRQYLSLCRYVLKHGQIRLDRTGTGTKSVFGYQARYNLAEGLPLATTKDMVTPNENGVSLLDMIIEELLWFLNGDTNVKTLMKKGVNIWNPDARRVHNAYLKQMGKEPISAKAFRQYVETSPLGFDLGRIYGKQWRSWNTTRMTYQPDLEYPVRETVDQIAEVIKSIKEDPFGRRHIVSAWNPGEIGEMALPPCHVMFQFYVTNDRKLSCQLYQRSGDLFLGVPFNIASYALLTMMIADQCGLGYGEFVHTFGDVHIYLNHIEQVEEQIKRQPHPLPKMEINTRPSIFDYRREDFHLHGYESHEALKGKVSVGD